MINILIPLAGKNQFFSEAEYPYPKPLIEINGKTMIEHILASFESIQKEKQFIFIVNNEDCKKYHLDNILNLLTDHTCKIIKIDGETKGAACSALMAIEHINNDTPLVIANADQIIGEDIQTKIGTLEAYDAGVITFDSVHPKWSYARVDSDGNITETAEKRPISKNAIAGFYYFKEGQEFVASAMSMIRKDASVNGLYFIAPALNEMILKNKSLGILQIDNSNYYTFYSPNKIKEYERMTQC